MMRACKPLTVGVGILLLGLVAASSAQAKLGLNGVSLNGIRFNGVSLNGIRFNGVSLNGIRYNGVAPATPTQAEPPVLKILSVTLPATQDR